LKKYKSAAAKVIHEDALDLYKDGIITEARMKEFDKSCLASNTETSGAGSGGKSPMVAAGSSPRGRSVK
jgi:DNA-binding transcriptional regulator YiaG